MDNFDEMSPTSTLARVRAVHDDVLYLELRGGGTATVTGADLPELNVGDVVLVRSNPNHIAWAPQELWPEELWVGIVRLKREDISVLTDPNGRLKQLPTRHDLSYSEGNTVEATDSEIIRVLSEDPIRYIDLPTVDDATIAKFRLQKDATKLSFEQIRALLATVARN